MAAGVVDLSTISPPQFVVKIGNGDDIKEIDLTIVPAALTLGLEEASAKYGSISLIPDEQMIDIVACICRHSNPEVTAEWLWKKCTKPQLVLLSRVVIDQAMRPPTGAASKKDGGGKKNP